MSALRHGSLEGKPLNICAHPMEGGFCGLLTGHDGLHHLDPPSTTLAHPAPEQVAFRPVQTVRDQDAVAALLPTEQDEKPVVELLIGWRFERIGCKVKRAVRYRGASIVADIGIGGLTEREINSVGHLIAAAPDLLEAAREGLILAEADVEDRRRQLEEWVEYEPEDSVLAVFVQRRHLIAAAIAKATGAA